jgi:hypothetical protein
MYPIGQRQTAGFGAQLPVRLYPQSPSQPARQYYPAAARDCRAAAVHGLAPQDVKARGDNDRGTEKQARGGHVSPQRESRAG